MVAVSAKADLESSGVAGTVEVPNNYWWYMSTNLLIQCLLHRLQRFISCTDGRFGLALEGWRLEGTGLVFEAEFFFSLFEQTVKPDSELKTVL